MEYDVKYMRRALSLAARGKGFVSPNPMVGAVIVSSRGRIIGEGWHRRFGEAHAEVNAVRSIAKEDLKLLPESTIYVTLEPCAHYGKTPPCAKLLIDCGIKRVVIGAVDPFAKVNGRGVAMLRESGAEVITGVLAQESISLNAHFFTAHTLKRPFVTLKWAMSSDGWMDCRRGEDSCPQKFSTLLTQIAVHKLRSEHDVIAVGTGTVLVDDPGLDVRLWEGRSPRPLVIGGTSIRGTRLCERAPLIYSATLPDSKQWISKMLEDIYASGKISILVEGGAKTLQTFIDAGLWDVARIEVAPLNLGIDGTVKAPLMPKNPSAVREYDGNIVMYCLNNDMVHVKNL